MWKQRAGAGLHGMVCWDYHCFALVRDTSGPSAAIRIFDLDRRACGFVTLRSLLRGHLELAPNLFARRHASTAVEACRMMTSSQLTAFRARHLKPCLAQHAALGRGGGRVGGCSLAGRLPGVAVSQPSQVSVAYFVQTAT